MAEEFLENALRMDVPLIIVMHMVVMDGFIRNMFVQNDLQSQLVRAADVDVVSRFGNIVNLHGDARSPRPEDVRFCGPAGIKGRFVSRCS